MTEYIEVNEYSEKSKIIETPVSNHAAVSEDIDNTLLSNLIIIKQDMIARLTDFEELARQKLLRLGEINSEALRRRIADSLHKELRNYIEQVELLTYDYMKLINTNEGVQSDTLMQLAHERNAILELHREKLGPLLEATKQRQIGN